MTASPGELPRVSVVLPTHNRAGLLHRAVQSALAQTYRNLELVVIDDGSTDTTREVLTAVTDPRLVVIHREVNGGAAAARNAGIARARGALIAFLDDDDFWLVQKLEKQVAAIQSAGPDVGWCVTGHVRLDRKCVYVGGSFHERELDYRRGVGPEGPDWSLIATPGWMVRREVLERLGSFDERIRSWDDWELGLRLSQATRRILVDEPLWVQDWLNGTGLIRAERARAHDLRVIMEKHGHLWADQPRVAARHWRVIGRAESLYDPAPAGRDALVRSVRLWPWQFRAWAALAVSFLGQPRVQWLTQQVRRRKNA